MDLRRRLLSGGYKPKRGTSDFFLENVTYTAHKQELDLKLLDEDKAFTVLCDWEVTAGYTTSYSIALDAFSCGEKVGSFSNAIRFGNYSTIAMAYLCSQGKYIQIKDDAGLRKKAAIRHDPSLTKNLWSRLTGTSSGEYTKAFTLTDANAVIGGANGNNPAADTRQGIIHGLYVYRRALTAEEMNNFIDNGIIP